MARSKFSTIAEANSSGSRLETLKATADYLADALDNCEAMRDAASLSLRLLTVLEQIESLEPTKKATAADAAKEKVKDRRKPGGAKTP